MISVSESEEDYTDYTDLSEAVVSSYDEEDYISEEPSICQRILKDKKAVQDVYGEDSVRIDSPLLDSVTIELRVSPKNVTKRTAQAWGVDLSAPIIITFSVSATSYLDFQPPRDLRVFQRSAALDKLGISSQLSFIISNFFSFRFSKKESNEVHNSLIDMGFSFTQAYSAALLPERTLEEATLAALSSDERKGDGFLCELIEYVVYRIPTLNTHCVICDQTHVFSTSLIKPAVCRRELCAFTYQEFGLVGEMITCTEVIDLLIAMARAAVNSARSNKILDPFPAVFDRDQTAILTPEKPNHQLAKELFQTIPIPFEIGPDKHSVSSLLVQWVISSNRTHLERLDASNQIEEMGTDAQYAMISASPEKEDAFQALKQKQGSSFAFHGSRSENWHSILRNGLKNASGTSLQLNGAAHGKGIYLSTNSMLSMGYSGMLGAVQKNFAGTDGTVGTDGGVFDDGGWICLALCEVIEDASIKKSGQIWVVPKEECVITRFFFVYKNGSSHLRGNNVNSLSGKTVSRITEVLRSLGGF